MADNGGGSRSFVIGLILGAIGGAAAALFMTPKSGDQLRQEVEGRVGEAAGPLREQAEPLVAQGKERATELIDRAAERAQELSGKIAAMEIPFDDDPERKHEDTGRFTPPGD